MATGASLGGERRCLPQRSRWRGLAPLRVGLVLLAAAAAPGAADAQLTPSVGAVVTLPPPVYSPSGRSGGLPEETIMREAGRGASGVGEQLGDAWHWVAQHGQKVVKVAVMLALVGAIVATKSFWMQIVYAQTCGLVHCPRIRNMPFVGRCAAAMCCCCVPPYHDPFRLRVVVHEGIHLKGSHVYVQLVCGNNPWKSTSVVKVPMESSHHPVVWNEPLEIEVTTSDNNVYVQLIESDGYIHGVVTLQVQEFRKNMEGDPGEVMYLKERIIEKRVLSGQRSVGTLKMSLYITPPGRRLTDALMLSDDYDDPYS